MNDNRLTNYSVKLKMKQLKITLLVAAMAILVSACSCNKSKQQQDYPQIDTTIAIIPQPTPSDPSKSTDILFTQWVLVGLYENDNITIELNDDSTCSISRHKQFDTTITFCGTYVQNENYLTLIVKPEFDENTDYVTIKAKYKRIDSHYIHITFSNGFVDNVSGYFFDSEYSGEYPTSASAKNFKELLRAVQEYNFDMEAYSLNSVFHSSDEQVFIDEENRYMRFCNKENNLEVQACYWELGCNRYLIGIVASTDGVSNYTNFNYIDLNRHTIKWAGRLFNFPKEIDDDEAPLYYSLPHQGTDDITLKDVGSGKEYLLKFTGREFNPK